MLAARAENADNRVILGEAADQLEHLAKLLPEEFDASTAAQPDTTTAASKNPGPEQDGKESCPPSALSPARAASRRSPPDVAYIMDS